MLATGSFEQFEVLLESVEARLPFEKRLNVPCSVKVKPECFYAPLRVICDGTVMYGHIPYDVSEELIASPSRMLWFLQEQGYEVLVSPSYEECKQADMQSLMEA